MDHPEKATESAHAQLIALLPRLRRLAAVLSGEREKSSALVRAACVEIVERAHVSERGLDFDHEALAIMYAIWLGDLRRQRQPITQAQGDETLYRAMLSGAEGALPGGGEVAGFLAGLPPQQRVALLLTYGERLSYEQAAKILDTPAETISARVNRAREALIARLGLMDGPDEDDTEIEELYPVEQRARA